MDTENIVYDYDPNISVIHGSLESTTTAIIIGERDLSGVEEINRDNNESIIDISELPIYVDDGIIEINNDVELFTKSGKLRKRKKYLKSVEMRKKIKFDLQKDQHRVLPGCDRQLYKTVKFVLFTKNQFRDKTYTTLDFLQKKYMNKKGMSPPSPHTKNCGIPKEKRDDTLSSLKQIIPSNRKQFWENITICN